MSYREKLGEMTQMEKSELLYHDWHLCTTGDSSCLLVGGGCLVS